MNYYEIAPTTIVRADHDMFTYSSAQSLPIGQLVRIPVGKNTLQGLVVRKTAKPAYATKSVEATLEPAPLPENLVRLSLWVAEYYRTPLATVLQTILPRGLGRSRREKLQPRIVPVRNRTKNVLNKEQRSAAMHILNNPSATTLLQGVTGSGKTEVYKELARHTTAKGKSVIILVPEISLTSQLVDEFIGEFPDTLVTHSQMTEAQRHTSWRQALTSSTPMVVVGPRSALFMPVPDLGLIIVDEAHEPSYKQEQAPRYSALRAATMLGTFSPATVVFGSATPLVTDRYVADTRSSSVVYLRSRARQDALPATVTVVDMKKPENFKTHRFLSDTLIKRLESSLALGQQSLLFHNRRGSASTTLCETCGWSAECPRCFVPLVLHTDAFNVQCHICGYHAPVPLSCPTCQAADIVHKGIGTKRIESEIQHLFPKARVARFDSNNTKQETLAARYADLYEGRIDIAIGTQVVAKGLDLPKLDTVAIIQADSGLALPDFAAKERAFQLIAQVVGRVGRDNRQTQVIVQSYQPTQPAVQYGIAQDYEGFYQTELKERQKSGFPPFRYLLQVTNSYKTETSAIRSAQALARQLRQVAASDVTILGPTPAFYERQLGRYRWQLTLKSPRRDDLVKLLTYIPPTHWQAELDPVSLL